MSVAEDVVAKGKVLPEWDQAEAEMKDIVNSAWDEVDSLGDDKYVHAVRFERDDAGNVVLDDDGTPNLVMAVDDNGQAVMDEHPLVHRANNHGLHAYRYEEMDDGSVVALYVNERDGNVKMKAFADIEEASLWSPRDERE